MSIQHKNQHNLFWAYSLCWFGLQESVVELKQLKNLSFIWLMSKNQSTNAQFANSIFANDFNFLLHQVNFSMFILIVKLDNQMPNSNTSSIKCERISKLYIILPFKWKKYWSSWCTWFMLNFSTKTIWKRYFWYAFWFPFHWWIYWFWFLFLFKLIIRFYIFFSCFPFQFVPNFCVKTLFDGIYISNSFDVDLNENIFVINAICSGFFSLDLRSLVFTINLRFSNWGFIACQR